MTALQAALAYTRRGWRVVPIPAGHKMPVVKGWQNLRLRAEEIPNHFSDSANVGVLLGKPSGWLVDVDLDHALAAPLAETFLPPTGAIFGRRGKPGSHRLYVCPGA
ncbi:MAG: bifunctional DNA primase/polymerase [Desulfotomaculales bacterium]